MMVRLYEFKDEYDKYLMDPTIERKEFLNSEATKLGFKHRSTLYTTYNNVSAYLKCFYTFRASVLENYQRHSSSQAKSHMVSSPNSQIDYGDLRQSILRSILTALDKYDSSMGALTTYINWWIRNAQTCSYDHEYGIAYVVPQAQKRKMVDGTTDMNNFSVSMDALASGDEKDLHEILSSNANLTDDILRVEDTQVIQRLVKSVDPYGIARLLLDIDEHFSDDDLRRMSMQTKLHASNKLPEKTVNKLKAQRRLTKGEH